MPDTPDQEDTELSQSVAPYGEPQGDAPFDGKPYGEPKGRGIGESEEEEHDFIPASKVEEWIQKVAQEAAERTREIHTGANSATKGEGPDQGPLVYGPDQSPLIVPESFVPLDRELATPHKEQVAAKAETHLKELKDEPEEDGLYFKYRVFKEPDNVYTHPTALLASYNSITEGAGQMAALAEEVRSFVFVLKPDTDHHARVALAAYAKSVAIEKPRLHNDLMEILTDRIL